MVEFTEFRKPYIPGYFDNWPETRPLVSTSEAETVPFDEGSSKVVSYKYMWLPALCGPHKDMDDRTLILIAYLPYLRSSLVSCR